MAPPNTGTTLPAPPDVMGGQGFAIAGLEVDGDGYRISLRLSGTNAQAQAVADYLSRIGSTLVISHSGGDVELGAYDTHAFSFKVTPAQAVQLMDILTQRSAAIDPAAYEPLRHFAEIERYIASDGSDFGIDRRYVYAPPDTATEGEYSFVVVSELDRVRAVEALRGRFLGNAEPLSIRVGSNYLIGYRFPPGSAPPYEVTTRMLYRLSDLGIPAVASPQSFRGVFDPVHVVNIVDAAATTRAYAEHANDFINTRHAFESVNIEIGINESDAFISITPKNPPLDERAIAVLQREMSTLTGEPIENIEISPDGENFFNVRNVLTNEGLPNFDPGQRRTNSLGGRVWQGIDWFTGDGFLRQEGNGSALQRFYDFKNRFQDHITLGDRGNLRMTAGMEFYMQHFTREAIAATDIGPALPRTQVPAGDWVGVNLRGAEDVRTLQAVIDEMEREYTRTSTGELNFPEIITEDRDISATRGVNVRDFLQSRQWAMKMVNPQMASEFYRRLAARGLRVTYVGANDFTGLSESIDTFAPRVRQMANAGQLGTTPLIAADAPVVGPAETHFATTLPTTLNESQMNIILQDYMNFGRGQGQPYQRFTVAFDTVEINGTTHRVVRSISGEPPIALDLAQQQEFVRRAVAWWNGQDGRLPASQTPELVVDARGMPVGVRLGTQVEPLSGFTYDQGQGAQRVTFGEGMPDERTLTVSYARSEASNAPDINSVRIDGKVPTHLPGDVGLNGEVFARNAPIETTAAPFHMVDGMPNFEMGEVQLRPGQATPQITALSQAPDAILARLLAPRPVIVSNAMASNFMGAAREFYRLSLYRAFDAAQRDPDAPVDMRANYEREQQLFQARKAFIAAYRNVHPEATEAQAAAVADAGAARARDFATAVRGDEHRFGTSDIGNLTDVMLRDVALDEHAPSAVSPVAVADGLETRLSMAHYDYYRLAAEQAFSPPSGIEALQALDRRVQAARAAFITAYRTRYPAATDAQAAADSVQTGARQFTAGANRSTFAQDVQAAARVHFEALPRPAAIAAVAPSLDLVTSNALADPLTRPVIAANTDVSDIITGRDLTVRDNIGETVDTSIVQDDGVIGRALAVPGSTELPALLDAPLSAISDNGWAPTRGRSDWIVVDATNEASARAALAERFAPAYAAQHPEQAGLVTPDRIIVRREGNLVALGYDDIPADATAFRLMNDTVGAAGIPNAFLEQVPSDREPAVFDERAALAFRNHGMDIVGPNRALDTSSVYMETYGDEVVVRVRPQSGTLDAAAQGYTHVAIQRYFGIEDMPISENGGSIRLNTSTMTPLQLQRIQQGIAALNARRPDSVTMDAATRARFQPAVPVEATAPVVRDEALTYRPVTAGRNPGFASDRRGIVVRVSDVDAAIPVIQRYTQTTSYEKPVPLRVSIITQNGQQLAIIRSDDEAFALGSGEQRALSAAGIDSHAVVSGSAAGVQDVETTVAQAFENSQDLVTPVAATPLNTGVPAEYINIDNPSAQNFFDVLGVPPDADDETIRTARNRLVQELQPAVDAGDTQAAARISRVNAAYAALRDAQARATYQAQLAGSVTVVDAGPLTDTQVRGQIAQDAPLLRITDQSTQPDVAVSPALEMDVGGPHGSLVEARGQGVGISSLVISAPFLAMQYQHMQQDLQIGGEQGAWSQRSFDTAVASTVLSGGQLTLEAAVSGRMSVGDGLARSLGLTSHIMGIGSGVLMIGAGGFEYMAGNAAGDGQRTAAAAGSTVAGAALLVPAMIFPPSAAVVTTITAVVFAASEVSRRMFADDEQRRINSEDRVQARAQEAALAAYRNDPNSNPTNLPAALLTQSSESELYADVSSSLRTGVPGPLTQRLLDQGKTPDEVVRMAMGIDATAEHHPTIEPSGMARPTPEELASFARRNAIARGVNVNNSAQMEQLRLGQASIAEMEALESSYRHRDIGLDVLSERRREAFDREIEQRYGIDVTDANRSTVTQALLNLEVGGTHPNREPIITVPLGNPAAMRFYQEMFRIQGEQALTGSTIVREHDGQITVNFANLGYVQEGLQMSTETQYVQARMALQRFAQEDPAAFARIQMESSDAPLRYLQDPSLYRPGWGIAGYGATLEDSSGQQKILGRRENLLGAMRAINPAVAGSTVMLGTNNSVTADAQVIQDRAIARLQDIAFSFGDSENAATYALRHFQEGLPQLASYDEATVRAAILQAQRQGQAEALHDAGSRDPNATVLLGYVRQRLPEQYARFEAMLADPTPVNMQAAEHLLVESFSAQQPSRMAEDLLGVTSGDGRLGDSEFQMIGQRWGAAAEEAARRATTDGHISLQGYLVLEQRFIQQSVQTAQAARLADSPVVDTEEIVVNAQPHTLGMEGAPAPTNLEEYVEHWLQIDVNDTNRAAIMATLPQILPPGVTLPASMDGPLPQNLPADPGFTNRQRGEFVRNIIARMQAAGVPMQEIVRSLTVLDYDNGTITREAANAGPVAQSWLTSWGIRVNGDRLTMTPAPQAVDLGAPVVIGTPGAPSETQDQGVVTQDQAPTTLGEVQTPLLQDHPAQTNDTPALTTNEPVPSATTRIDSHGVQVAPNVAQLAWDFTKPFDQRSGRFGARVTEMQTLLNDLGFPILDPAQSRGPNNDGVNGIWGSRTDAQFIAACGQLRDENGQPLNPDTVLYEDFMRYAQAAIAARAAQQSTQPVSVLGSNIPRVEYDKLLASLNGLAGTIALPESMKAELVNGVVDAHDLDALVGYLRSTGQLDKLHLQNGNEATLGNLQRVVDFIQHHPPSGPIQHQ